MSGFLCETKLDRRRVVRCPCGGDLRVQLGLSITAQSYLLHQAKGRHCHNLHLTVWPACLHIGPLTSFHRCFSIRSTQQASIIQLRHGKAKVSLSGVTYKAAFFPHIRLGFGSTTTTAVAHISTRLYQHQCTHKPFTRTTYLSNLQAILVLRLDQRPFKRENKTARLQAPQSRINRGGQTANGMQAWLRPANHSSCQLQLCCGPTWADPKHPPTRNNKTSQLLQ